MKLSIIILSIVLIIGVGIGLTAYTRQQLPVRMPAVPTVSVSVTPQIPVTEDVSAIPTVAQITLRITSPSANSTVTSSRVSISGVTVPNADVFVNDSETHADATGNFSVPVILDEGDNSIVVSANDAGGNYAQQEITVTYNAGQ